MSNKLTDLKDLIKETFKSNDDIVDCPEIAKQDYIKNECIEDFFSAIALIITVVKIQNKEQKENNNE